MQLENFRKQVRSLNFSLLSPEQVKRLSAAKIVTPELYDIDGFPVDGGLMDLRLGAIDPGVRCRTCGKRLRECSGHPGSIELARPVFHIKYIQLIEHCLRSFCPSCGKLTLSDEKQKIYGPAERAKKARDAKKCAHCNEVIERVKLEKPTTFMSGKKRLSPIEVRDRIIKVPDEELKKTGINPKTARPEWAVLSLLLVPSVTVRPSITLEEGTRSEDDLTHKLSDIIRANQRLWENLNAGAPEVIIEDLWDLLQYHVTTFFDNNISRIPPARHRSGQPLKTITERIKGKEGRIRANLSGKRVNYSARTVISPDPYLKINEIGVPLAIAKTITVAEPITTINIEFMKEVVKKAEEYPGANYVIRTDGKRKRITKDLKEEICAELKPGYRIERHLKDGDVVLFNRQPTLHKQGLMAHFVKVLPDRTFKLHPASASPYNADFDGDEMNLHCPQTEEAQAEAKILLDINNNIISSKNNTNLVGTVDDAITGLYVLGKEEFDKNEADQLLYTIGIANSNKKKRISGHEIFSQIIPKGSEITIPNAISSKSSFGVEDGEMVKLLDKEFGREITIDCIDKAFMLGTQYLTRHGYSLSLDDLNVPEKVKELTVSILARADIKTKEIIESYKNGKLEAMPGKTLEETRENKILQVLNEVRTEIGEAVKEYFPADSNVSKMINSGARGSLLNITQIGCCVGQQALWGKRISFGYNDRTLSFFKKGDLTPAAQGFIKSSFFKGLIPTEFFFGAITGRDSLMDTALRTPKSGYLHRRLVYALQDLKIEYDMTVRDASEHIVQFAYGDDSKDISKLHLHDSKVSPAEAVGIVTAQSFGEASTQMVLNVFHHAGISQMQVTQGLPRLIELIDARKQPSTPLMELYLDKEHNNEKDARIIAEKIKEVKLKDVLSEIKIDFSNKRIEIILDNKAVRAAHITPAIIAERLKDKGLKIKSSDLRLSIDTAELDFKAIYKLKEKIKELIISGVKNISQIFVSQREKDFVIVTAGSNLKDILDIKGIDVNNVTSNDIFDVMNVFGIEAARQTIINEIKKVIESQGLDINERHIKLIADAMAVLGTIKGVTRMGIISDKASILARATFETPDKQFIGATLKGLKEELNSVIENILLNQPIPVGSGLPGLLVKVTGPLVRKGDKDAKKRAEEE
ncbi:MAG: DNA-directed RNA polymerase subunit A' [Nanoarchaeota archaeon]